MSQNSAHLESSPSGLSTFVLATPMRARPYNTDRVAASNAIVEWDNMEYTFQMPMPRNSSIVSMSDTETAVNIAPSFAIPAFVYYCCRHIMKHVISKPSPDSSFDMRQWKVPTEHSHLESTVNDLGLVAVLSEDAENLISEVMKLLFYYLKSNTAIINDSLEPVFRGFCLWSLIFDIVRLC